MKTEYIAAGSGLSTRVLQALGCSEIIPILTTRRLPGPQTTAAGIKPGPAAYISLACGVGCPICLKGRAFRFRRNDVGRKAGHAKVDIGAGVRQRTIQIGIKRAKRLATPAPLNSLPAVKRCVPRIVYVAAAGRSPCGVAASALWPSLRDWAVPQRLVETAN